MTGNLIRTTGRGTRRPGRAGPGSFLSANRARPGPGDTRRTVAQGGAQRGGRTVTNAVEGENQAGGGLISGTAEVPAGG